MHFSVHLFMGMGLPGGEAHELIAELAIAEASDAPDEARAAALAKRGFELVEERFSLAHGKWTSSTILRRKA